MTGHSIALDQAGPRRAKMKRKKRERKETEVDKYRGNEEIEKGGKRSFT